MSQDCDTSGSMAPKLFSSQKYNKKADVYSIGIILWQMLTKEKPFKNLSGIQVCVAVSSKNERPEIPVFTQKESKNLITSCYDIKPKNRPSFVEFVKFWMKEKLFILALTKMK
jgi:serine/threonine protein kinase